jgi:ketosteroid isomerase-like protein
MSQENVEVVLSMTEAFQRRDREALERSFDPLDPEVEWDASRLADVVPDIAGVFQGHDGVRDFWRRWLTAWRDLRFDIQEVLDAGDEVVSLIHNQRMWGRHSGIEVKFQPYGWVYTFRGDKIVRVRWYPDQESALEAAGLRE